MKKNILLILTAVFLLIGCSKSTDNNLIKYSNLTDKDSKDYVSKSLSNVNIPEENINTLLASIDEFNNAVENITLTETFKEVENVEPKYDTIKMQELWEKKNPVFLGNNCRITAFSLLKDNIEIGNSELSMSTILMFDEDSIINNENRFITDEELDKFYTLYSEIPTEFDHELEFYVNQVKEAFKNRNITFNDKIHMISVFINSAVTDEENILFIGHTGVLLNTEDNKLLFIEKLAFEEPYQAIIFNNKSELNDYLMAKYDTEWGQKTIRPFIMDNMELIEGYRLNPNNKGEQ